MPFSHFVSPRYAFILEQGIRKSVKMSNFEERKKCCRFLKGNNPLVYQGETRCSNKIGQQDAGCHSLSNKTLWFSD